MGILVKRKDFGDVVSGVQLKHTFRGDVDIVSAKPSCGCLNVFVRGTDLDVMYRPDSVPRHLRGKGYYESMKHISVMYSDGSKDLLTIVSKVGDR